MSIRFTKFDRSRASAEKQFFAFPAARRELIAITGIAEQGNVADVEFTWRWIPLNEVGAVFYSPDAHYQSTVGFRRYDDGWRVVQGAYRSRPASRRSSQELRACTVKSHLRGSPRAASLLTPSRSWRVASGQVRRL